ncbi:hypothetical protein RDn1_048 [Candidatus Termititenax dinenymphae]|uniref:Uncharacterized protein n=1 Tax=Candidatus Termititenax dinenymphae TaxID=2218523 RepID=A0A388TJD6_9BACT|nr:hypothetical protein RDn1_048 [Candidatus Termititenax dinenymphae]
MSKTPSKTKIKNNSKVSASTPTQKILSELEVFGDQRFYFCNGQIVSRLNELPQILRNIDDSTFNYHINQTKNDIASWIRDVFLQKDLAAQITKSRNRTEIVAALEKVLAR